MSFARIGTATAARTARRSSSEPPQWRGSVRTEIARAPAATYRRACDAVARRDETHENIVGRATIDRLGGEPGSLAHIPSESSHVTGRPGVHQDRRARPTLLAVQDSARHLRISRRVAANDLGPPDGLNAKVLRLDPALADRPVTHFPRSCWKRRADLVEAIFAVDHERVIGAKLDQHARDLLTERGRGNPEQHPAH